MQPMNPMQQPMQPMQPMQPPKKKGLSGCAIAAIIVGVLFVIGGIVVVGVVVWAANKVKTVAADMQAAAKEAESAPGAAELRAAGCKTALVIDPSKFASEAFKDFPGVAGKIDAGTGLLVTCNLAAGDTMTCDEVAKTFVGAPGHAPGPFTATVANEKGNQECGQEYDATGKPLHGAAHHE